VLESESSSLISAFRCLRRFLLAFIALFLLSSLMTTGSDAEPAPGGMKNGDDLPVVIFDIPAQPLEAALKIFGSTTQLTLFYESSIVAGHRSFPVHGEFPVDAALRVMLQGTGLSTASFDRGSITILSSSQTGDAADVKRAKAGLAEFSSYLALVQQRLDQAFCGLAVASGSSDEFLARIWISMSGSVSRAELLRPGTGNTERDRIYEATLGALAIGATPPAAMPQPINMMIVPKKSQESPACAEAATDARPAAQKSRRP
jgi:hypothetical protein